MARIIRGSSVKGIWTSRDDTTPLDIISNKNSILNSKDPSCIGNSVSPMRTGNQDIFSPNYPSVAKRGRNAEPCDATINEFQAVNGHSTSYFRGEIDLDAVSRVITDVNERERMNFVSISVLGKTPKFVDLGLSPAHTTDKLKSVIGPATRSGGLTYNSDWIASCHFIAEVTEVKVREV